MKTTDKEAYEKLVDMWSLVYKKKMRGLFSLEELKQEAWVAILEAEKKAEALAENKIAYLSQSIKHKIIDMLIQELKHKTTDTAPSEKVEVSLPEGINESKQLLEQLKLNIGKIPHANFVLTHMSSQSLRGISELAQDEGVTLSKSAIHKIVILIREEFDKILRRE